MVQSRISIIAVFIVFISCTKDKGIVTNTSNYPKDIEAIIIPKCATSGCHNSISKEAAGGLSLASWESLFYGGRGGSVVVPYRPDFSTLCFYTNSYPDLGPDLQPRMPVTGPALTREEYLSLRDWILAGAPAADGSIKFGNTLRKIYITNQLCDLMTVIDADSKLVMRYINTGGLSKTEFPVCVKVAPDKKHWYVTFLASSLLQKFDAQNDSYQSEIDLGNTGVWTSFDITADSRYAFCVDKSSQGKISCIDLQQMKIIATYSHSAFVYPQGIVLNNFLKKIYVGVENGNFISVINYTDLNSPIIEQIILDGSSSLNFQSSNDPAFLLSDEGNGLCFIACRNSKEIKILNTVNNSIAASIPLGSSPTYMDLDKTKNRLFVTCNDDSLSFPNSKGSVKIIDVATKQIIKTVNPGYEPNGISINPSNNYAAIVNSNVSPKGPKPHHTTGCTGRNGYVTFIDLNTLELIPAKKYELAVYPYAIALKED
jgi:DNA-binding beta-propeller fold protein YncE